MQAQETILPLGGRLLSAPPVPAARGTVLICPGGGYEWLSPREAEPVAAAFNRAGWNAAILYYTVRTAGAQPLGTLPLRQLGEAVAFLQCGNPVIVCGFSAGGHLACSLGVHWQKMALPRPDALILGYPVVTAGPYAHRGSIENLAGDGDSDFYSLERHAGPQVPPAFLWHTVTDPEVPVQNSLLLASALADAGVRYEMHLYPRGVHGLSLATPEVEEPAKHRLADPHIAGWFELCQGWLDSLWPKPALAAPVREGVTLHGTLE